MATALEAFRRLYLQQALAQTIKDLELATLNAQLDELAPAADLRQLASTGLRGEFLFPTPSILLANPRLLGYYRLLLGFSQKEFFNKGKLGRFKSMEASAKSHRNLVAIEIKGGGDQSNIWNRLGEAEISHQTAKQRGFVEFWTIYNVPQLDPLRAHEKSPTTNRFYNLRDLLLAHSEELDDFRDRLVSTVGIAAPPAKPNISHRKAGARSPNPSSPRAA